MTKMDENIRAQLEGKKQAVLNAAGLSDVKFKVGWFRVGK
jgi:hypothetical protein